MSTRPSVAMWAWRASDDTGASSLNIWHAMTGTRNPSADFPPRDPSDFGRCHRLLQKFPAWRKRFIRVMSRRAQWAPFVRCWNEMERLYERDLPTGRSEELYALMTKCLEARK